MMFGGVLRDCSNSQYLTVVRRLSEVAKEAGLSCFL